MARLSVEPGVIQIEGQGMAGCGNCVLDAAVVGAPARVVVRVYAAQRKPVASGRGASGLPGSPPGGSSSL
jgi:hypothetical protein